MPSDGEPGTHAQWPGGAELTTVYRQRNTKDMRDFTDLGAGKVEEAVRSLHARDPIYVLDEYRHRAAARFK